MARRFRWYLALVVAVVVMTGATAFVPGVGWGWRLLDGIEVQAQGDGFPDEASADAAAEEVLGTDWPGATVDGTWHYVGESGEPAFESDWGNLAGWPLAYRIREPGIVDIQGIIEDDGSGGVITTLPEDYRPSVASFFAVVGEVQATSVLSPMVLSVGTNGQLFAQESGDALDVDRVYISGQFFLESPLLP